MASRAMIQSSHKVLFSSHKLAARQSVQALLRMSHKKEHLELTADQYRDPGASAAQVVSITQLSDTVKGLTLQLAKNQETELKFHAGQWLDFFIPGEEKVGGFSMCSCPSDLSMKGTMDLAVKFSTWAPAHWVHTQCRVGDWITFRFGGDFYYPSSGIDGEHSLLLVAGGVGINPLYSIWQAAAHLARTCSTNSPTSVSMLYSAASKKELIFSDEIDREVEELKHFTTSYFITRESEDAKALSRRISKTDLQLELEKKAGSRTVCYLCGPPDMVDQMRLWLEELGVKKEDIKFELWW